MNGDFGTSRLKSSCAHDTHLAMRAEEGEAGQVTDIER
jgi:hypothetical protein